MTPKLKWSLSLAMLVVSTVCRTGAATYSKPFLGTTNTMTSTSFCKTYRCALLAKYKVNSEHTEEVYRVYDPAWKSDRVLTLLRFRNCNVRLGLRQLGMDYSFEGLEAEIVRFGTVAKFNPTARQLDAFGHEGNRLQNLEVGTKNYFIEVVMASGGAVGETVFAVSDNPYNKTCP